eukprot:517683-Prorocentrum_minimum.AAC.1
MDITRRFQFWAFGEVALHVRASATSPNGHTSMTQQGGAGEAEPAAHGLLLRADGDGLHGGRQLQSVAHRNQHLPGALPVRT